MVNLSISGDSIVFEFINSNYYLQNGKIATPINSLALITDESNIATFKKASSNDIFVAATYDELGKSKNELIEWFKDNAVGATGGGGLTPEEAQEMIDSSISGKADTSALTVFFDGVEYNSNNKTIEFYNGNVLKDSIDATAFIKDGMVDTVSIEDITSGGTTVKCLVITFNTDSGKEDIEIPLIDIFNPNNYYDKTATDGLLDAKVDLTAYTAYTSSTETALNGKASQTDLETVSGNVATVSGNVDTLSGQVADKADTTAMTTALADKLDISTFETFSGNVNTALSGKASQTDLNTVSGDVATVSGSVANKQDILVSGTNIKTINNTSLLGSGDIEISVEVDDELDIDSPNAVANSAITKTIQDNELVIANALINLQNDVNGKADASDLNGKVDVSTYTAYTAATDTALNGKQATLVSGTNIKTINNTSLLGSGNIDIQGGGQTVTSVTQAEYDSLTTKDPDTFYIISDATGSTITIDPSLDSGSTNAVVNSAITIAIDTVSAATSSNTTSLNGLSLWKGTTAQYEAIVTKDNNTIYFVVD